MWNDVSLLPDCNMGDRYVFHSGTFLLPNAVKQRAYKATLQVVLIRYAKEKEKSPKMNLQHEKYVAKG